MNTRFYKATSTEVEEAEGARVRRLFPTEKQESFDPFVLLDEFFLESSAEIPPHPHRGFESITYVLDGQIRHWDDQGNESIVETGGTQQINTGRGIVHSEGSARGKPSHGLQVWINLPRSLKKSPPTYTQAKPCQFPVEAWEGGQIKTICGPSSPVQLRTPLIYQDIRLEAQQTLQLRSECNHSCLVYVLAGELKVGAHRILPGEGLFFTGEEEVSAQAVEKTHFVFLSGLPHKQSIQLHDTYVD